MTEYRSSQYEIVNYTYQGPSYVYFGVPRHSFSVPPVKFCFTGNDPRQVLREDIPRPVYGGIYGGPFTNLIEDVRLGLEPIPANKGKAPKGYRIKDEAVKLTGDTPYSDDPFIRPYIIPQGGINFGTHYVFGGGIEPRATSLTVVRVNELNKAQEYYEIHYYYKGVLLCPQRHLGGKTPEVLSIEFSAAAGNKADGCVLDPGWQIGVVWFVKIDPETGDNILINPRYPEVAMDDFSFCAIY